MNACHSFFLRKYTSQVVDTLLCPIERDTIPIALFFMYHVRGITMSKLVLSNFKQVWLFFMSINCRSG